MRYAWYDMLEYISFIPRNGIQGNSFFGISFHSYTDKLISPPYQVITLSTISCCSKELLRR